MLGAKSRAYSIQPWQAYRVMTAMVWKLLLLLLLLWDGPTFQNRKTKMTLAHQVSSGHAFPLRAY